MHPIVRKGRFWQIRRGSRYALFALFFALPLIPIGGHPAVLLDLATRRFHVLGGTFYPTDNLLLVAFGFGTIVTVFFVGSTFGRMWCGFALPADGLPRVPVPARSRPSSRAGRPTSGSSTPRRGPRASSRIKAAKWTHRGRCSRC